MFTIAARADVIALFMVLSVYVSVYRIRNLLLQQRGVVYTHYKRRRTDDDAFSVFCGGSSFL